ncbi:hypothetical protein BDZ89DRAFT_1168451 [Hymenopellis radicata]|nr:hypothetical protein BDZ89DRAFT_1168451 [Hymenopellis radicata]
MADVLFGKHNPSGKLSLTFPKVEEDVPSYGHFHSRMERCDMLKICTSDTSTTCIGTSNPPLHSPRVILHDISLSNLSVSKPSFTEKDVSFTASLNVTNTGSVKGSEVVQVYMSLPKTSHLTHPPLQLRGFAKVRGLEPGKTDKVTVRLDKYAVSYWDDKIECWVVEKGEYEVKGWDE